LQKGEEDAGEEKYEKDKKLYRPTVFSQN